MEVARCLGVPSAKTTQGMEEKAMNKNKKNNKKATMKKIVAKAIATKTIGYATKKVANSQWFQLYVLPKAIQLALVVLTTSCIFFLENAEAVVYILFAIFVVYRAICIQRVAKKVYSWLRTIWAIISPKASKEAKKKARKIAREGLKSAKKLLKNSKSASISRLADSKIVSRMERLVKC